MISSYTCHANASNSQSLENHKHVYIYNLYKKNWFPTITIESSIGFPFTINECMPSLNCFKNVLIFPCHVENCFEICILN